MSWEPWWANVRVADPNLVSGGIFAHNGAICYSEAQCNGADIVAAVTGYTSPKINGKKFMRLGDNDDCVNLRSGASPAIIFKAGTTYILAIAAEGTDAGTFAKNVIDHMRSPIFFDADSETFII